MVPYKRIRRWSVGEDSSLLPGERVIRVIHRLRIVLDTSWTVIATPIFLAVEAPLWCIAYCWLASLLMPNLFTAAALSSSNKRLIIGLTYLSEFLGIGLLMWATQFNALITVSSVFIASVLASNLGGILPGLLGGMVPVVSGWFLSVLLGERAGEHIVGHALVGGYAALCVFTSIWLQSALVKLSQDASEMRRTIKSLNTQIKEQVLVRYLPPALINDIFEGKVSMDTKPATQEITVLFSDLSGFTKMSEEQGAETVADFLNDYLTVMNETIFANNGTIDKFIGDAIMVLFGAPVPMTVKEQAENAARCARAMQAGMVLVNEKWKARGLNEVSMRIGIHQGTAVVGNFGSVQRVDYTAIGPSVNLASRIESACVPGEIFVSPEIRELLSPELTEQAGEYELKGISGKTSLYRLVKL